MNKKLITILVLIVFTVVLTIGYFNAKVKTEEAVAAEVVITPPEEILTEYRYGFSLDEYEIVEGKIKRNETFADIVSPYNVSLQDIFTMDRISSQVHSVRKLVSRKDYAVLYKKDSIKKASYFVYEPNPSEYIVYQLEDTLAVYRTVREIEVIEKTMAGMITASLNQAIIEQGGSPALVSAMADLYGWQIDMRSLRRGDWFKLIYEEKRVDGEYIGIGDVIGAEFSHMNNAYMAYGFDDGNGLNYYDEKGESMQKAFLRYPVEYSRISSRYNPRRFHPVLKRTRPHLGTDYAAPRGTEIKAAGDGVIVARGWTNGNGNYIKIKHNGTYTTGYLHMSRFGKFKNGQRVKKGDVIGYVGKTGLATGHHLCFRFWKRGVQVDFLREKLPAEEPLGEDHMLDFEIEMKLINKKLSDIQGVLTDESFSANSN